MNGMQSPASSIAEQAAHWHARHRQGPLGSDERLLFMDWLALSPEHLREYFAMAQMGGALAEAMADEDVDALLARPVAASASNVVPLRSSPAPLASTAPRDRPRSRLPRLALAASVALAVLGVGGWMGLSEQAQFEAAHGQPRQLQLSDGTTVQLDADSRLSVHFTPLQRRVDVQRGRAAFVVAEGRRRFEVRASGLRVHDIGTTFSVALQREQARVDVLEGRVHVRADADAQLLADIGPGQSARIDYRDHRVQLRQEPAEAISGWWQGRIVFNDEALRDVVDQFNRRNTLQVVVDDAQAGALRLSGNLRAEGTDTLAAYLRAQDALQVRQQDGRLHVSTRVR